ILFMRDKLRPGCLYRADRCDVPTEVPGGAPFDQVLDFCRRQKFRIHATGFTLVKKPNGGWRPRSPSAAILGIIWRGTIKSVWLVGIAIGRNLGFGDRPPAHTARLPGEGVLRHALRDFLAKLKT